MKTTTKVLTCIGIALTGLSGNAAQAQLVNGWFYTKDALNDGSGGAVYEMRGMAYRVINNDIYFAFSSPLNLAGNPVGGALNGRVNLGDLFINFSGGNLDTQAKFGNAGVFGVRFSSLNDSFGNTSSTPNTNTGVYRNIGVSSLTTANSGYGTLAAYNSAGFGRTVDAMGDLESTTGDVKSYLSDQTMYPNMLTGTKIADITLQTRANLTALGLNFSTALGAGYDTGATADVFGFKFNRLVLPQTSFTAHVFEECINDGVAIRGTNVPEPGSIAMVGAGAIAFCGLVIRRRRG